MQSDASAVVDVTAIKEVSEMTQSRFVTVVVTEY